MHRMTGRLDIFKMVQPRGYLHEHRSLFEIENLVKVRGGGGIGEKKNLMNFDPMI